MCLYQGCGRFHVFGEGNTRTTAVFFIKCLRTLGFDATNDIFAENALKAFEIDTDNVNAFLSGNNVEGMQ